jgi:hypothetical protein
MEEMSDALLVKQSLHMWANYIETGDVTVSSADLHNMGKPTKYLDANQHLFVARLRSLASQVKLEKCNDKTS